MLFHSFFQECGLCINIIASYQGNVESNLPE